MSFAGSKELLLRIVARDNASADLKKVGGQTDKLGGRAKAASGKLRLLGLAAGASLAAAIYKLGKSFITTTDQLHQFENRLKLTTSSAVQLNEVQNKLFAVARRTRSDVFALGETYNRMALAAKDFGLNSNDLLEVTEAIGKAAAISGASSIEASNALRQFTQGIQSGRLGGEELRAVFEQLPALARSIANGMDVPVGKLRELGKAGKLVPKQILEAIKKDAPNIAAQFGQTTATMTQGATVMKTGFTELTDVITDMLGLKGQIGGFMSYIGDAAASAAAWLRGHDETLQTQAELVASRNEVVGREMPGSLLGNTTQEQLDFMRQQADDLEKINAELTRRGHDRRARENSDALRASGGDLTTPSAAAAAPAAAGINYDELRGTIAPEEAPWLIPGVIPQPEGVRDGIIKYMKMMREASAEKLAETEKAAEEERALLEDLGLNPQTKMEQLLSEQEREREMLAESFATKANYKELEAQLADNHRKEQDALNEADAQKQADRVAKQADKERATKRKLYSDLIGFASVFGKEGQRIARAITAVQKTEAFIQSVLSIQTGAANALKDVPFPANIAAVAAVLAQGAGLLATLKSVGGGGGGGGGGGSVSSSPSASFSSSAVLESPAAIEPARKKQVRITLNTTGRNLFNAEDLRDVFRQFAEAYGGEDNLNIAVVT